MTKENQRIGVLIASTVCMYVLGLAMGYSHGYRDASKERALEPAPAPMAEIKAASLDAPVSQYQMFLPLRLPVGAYIYVDDELMMVMGWKDSMSIVMRGVDGTRAGPHARGATMYFPAKLPAPPSTPAKPK